MSLHVTVIVIVMEIVVLTSYSLKYKHENLSICSIIFVHAQACPARRGGKEEILNVFNYKAYEIRSKILCQVLLKFGILVSASCYI